MKSVLIFIAALAFGTTGWGQQTLARFNWKDAPGGPPRGAVAISLDGRDALKIESTNEAGLQVALLTIEKPKISNTFYVVQGEVRYEAVQGDGFLEMWNYFPPAKPGAPEGEYFSRTLGESGEMGKIRGTSDWRPFQLPFNSAGAVAAPIRLQINLHLPGRGTVYIGPLRLVEYSEANSAPAGHPGYDWFFGSTSHPWWSNSASIWGGNLGTLWMLCFGLLIGLLAYKGKGRGLVLALLKLHVGVGILCGAAAATALTQHQPFSVWFPLSLFGFLLIVINSALLFSMDKWYRELELRRMQSLDVS
jgi:hypothetical protein